MRAGKVEQEARRAEWRVKKARCDYYAHVKSALLLFRRETKSDDYFSCEWEKTVDKNRPPLRFSSDQPLA
ncbi:MAG: hypothetical protein WA197_19015 [Candidatus Acidiferrales bacterium]